MLEVYEKSPPPSAVLLKMRSFRTSPRNCHASPRLGTPPFAPTSTKRRVLSLYLRCSLLPFCWPEWPRFETVVL